MSDDPVLYDVAVGLRALERREQRVEQLVGQRVARVRLIERDRRDAAGDGVEDRVIGHGGEPYAVGAGIAS